MSAVELKAEITVRQYRDNIVSHDGKADAMVKVYIKGLGGSRSLFLQQQAVVTEVLCACS
jgi:hypothetical protein